MRKCEYDVCVIGGGPAGSVTALRLARLGHQVCLIEKRTFPRPHVGESLTPGAKMIGRLLDVEDLFPEEMFHRTDEKRVLWSGPCEERLRNAQSDNGLLVDRGEFDRCLLKAAKEAGVWIIQPGNIFQIKMTESAWLIEVISEGVLCILRSRFVVDAAGRNGFLRGHRVKVGAGLMALCGDLHIPQSSNHIIIEAIHEGWCWGAPISKGRFSVMVFVDHSTIRSFMRKSIEKLWRAELGKAKLFDNYSDEPLMGPILARDATPYYVTEPIAENFAKVGESSFGIDPISSTGVEKAMHNSFMGGTVIHTMLIDADRQEMCIRFFKDRQRESVFTHVDWSKENYSKVHHRFKNNAFWKLRGDTARIANQRHLTTLIPSRSPFEIINLNTRVGLSEHAMLVKEPCIVGDEICYRMALVHPSLNRPVAFIEGQEVGDFLSLEMGQFEVKRLVRALSEKDSIENAYRITTWLLRQQILEVIQ